MRGSPQAFVDGFVVDLTRTFPTPYADHQTHSRMQIVAQNTRLFSPRNQSPQSSVDAVRHWYKAKHGLHFASKAAAFAVPSPPAAAVNSLLSVSLVLRSPFWLTVLCTAAASFRLGVVPTLSLSATNITVLLFIRVFSGRLKSENHPVRVTT